jgi:Ser/Thr protein kinase RdoA (MazF antagonist)
MTDVEKEKIKNRSLKPKEIIDFVNANYPLERPFSCEFIRCGYNDHYKITAGKTDYIFRVYLNGKYYIQSSEDFLFELELLEFLYARGVPVTSPIRQQDNSLLGQLEDRSTALFSFAPGVKKEELPSPTCCFNWGKALAAFHLTANDFHSPYHRYHLNLEHLITRPLEMIEERGTTDYQELLQTLQPVEDLVASVQKLSKGGDSYGIIHGDLHPGNMHFGAEDEVTFFDFDHCAFGWRAYDLCIAAYFPQPQSEALLQGYETLRPLTEEESNNIPMFAKVREKIWDMGDYLTIQKLKQAALQGASKNE